MSKWSRKIGSHRLSDFKGAFVTDSSEYFTPSTAEAMSVRVLLASRAVRFAAGCRQKTAD